MRTLRCKCGKCVQWTSMGTQDCQGCEECKTTFASHPDQHKELKPHDYSVIRYNQSTGKTYKKCSRCHDIDYESFNESKTNKLTDINT